ncbi:1-deoxy-D-xylulose-5-phosphate synthase [Mycoplasmoides alvi]|uniref:1-deoxy-D-xylulose-5-phosphate synthase n=1 Tax=Mycoplasmoides alvi TaxID=78580 RepID=UPI00051C1CEF|nr:1-deoxy-D-xylulose-5-phosphate synthase [Mycoplasmoides alvi]
MTNKSKNILNSINEYSDFKKIDKKFLNQLSFEIRSFIIELSKNKNIHLGSNLGIIETTIALSKEFDLNKDILFYDTGHQAYVHKILTGRKNLMHTIRDTNGIAGMQNMKESIYDYYSGGHSGNSLSIASGFLESIKFEKKQIEKKWEILINNFLRIEKNKKKLKKLKKLKKTFQFNEKYVVPIIGDSAIANGMACEALSDISFRDLRPIIVLNDNGMSISKSVGSIPLMISNLKTNKLLSFIEKFLYLLLWNTKFGKNIYSFLYKNFHKIGQLLYGGNIFTSLGYQYIGPINGHNIKKLIIAIKKAKWYQKFQPVVLHIKTEKGKGLNNNKKDLIGINHSSNLESKKIKTTGEYLSEHLLAWVNLNKSIYVINPAMTYNSGFLKFSKIHKENYLDVGISEEHAISMASGMSIKKLKPIVVIYSSFLQRSYDQLLHDHSRLNLPLTLLIDRAEISGGDGDSHHGIFDVSFLKTFPNTIITSPSNIMEAKMLIDFSIESNTNNIFAIRYPKMLPFISLNEHDRNEIQEIIKNKRWRFINTNDKNKFAIVTYGKWVNIFLDLILDNDFKVDVINAIYINSYQPNLLEEIFNKYKNICVFEEIYGDLGLSNDFLKFKHKKDVKILVKNFKCFPGSGNNKDIYKNNSLDPLMTLKELINL